MIFKCDIVINKGLCKGDCCGCVPLPIKTFEKYKDLIQAKITETIETQHIDEVYKWTEDCKCVFLHRVTFKCLIYKDRPSVCKSYGIIPELPCPYIKPNGNLRSPAGIKHFERKINRDVENSLRKIKRNINKFK